MPNRLAEESSPYLLQHQENPVDWYPWGEEAFAKAKADGKPIFLSIGYSACHWCHVMEHESFESEAIAAQLNDSFVSVKVDREERPDLDQIYMSAVQMMTGHGGWPMSVFLDHQGRPFFGGTYWPPQRRMGMPGFPDVLAAVLDAWEKKQEQLGEQAALLTEKLQQPAASDEGNDVPLGPELLSTAAGKLHAAFDFTHGGFGQAPKFPHPMDVQLLLRLWQRSGQQGLLDMAKLNLDKMAAGGIYDHLGGGFARYSVDERWLVPHFEKMLYDNALLTTAYVEAWQVTRDDNYRRVACETLDYILRDMTDEAGGFCSTEDADSEGVEGKFYVWSRAEVLNLLGEEAGERFCYVYDVSDAGNWEDTNILNLPKTIAQAAKVKGWDEAELNAELAESRRRLYEAREQRVHPGKDDKVLTSWNGLMIDAMARAASAFGRSTVEAQEDSAVARRALDVSPGNAVSGALQPPLAGDSARAKYLQAATRAATFILDHMTRDDGRLLHTYRHGTAKLDAYLDDYACFINALVSLYESTFDGTWIDHAVRLAEVMLAQFKDLSGQGFFFTATAQEKLIARQKDLQDSSVPSGNAMAATALLRLGKLTGRNDLSAAAESCLRLGAGLMAQYPTAAGQMLVALDFYLGPTHEVVLLTGEGEDENVDPVLGELRTRFAPRMVLSGGKGEEVSAHLADLFAGKEAGAQSPTLFICQDFTCQAPAVGKEAAIAAINNLEGVT